MNKIVLMGRCTRDIEVRYSTGEKPMAVARYTLAVQRRFKREGEAEADFIPCVVFGKAAEFAEKYFRQGTKVVVSGRIQTGSYTNRDGQKVYTTEVVVEEQEFAESKGAGGVSAGGIPEGIQSGQGSGYHGPGKEYYSGQDTGYPYGQDGGYRGGQIGQQGDDQAYQQRSFSTDRDGFMSIPDGAADELPFH